jgi:hypothetical protein
MIHVRKFVILTLAVLTTGMFVAELCGAAPKKAPPPKKAAPKVRPHHNPGPKPNRAVHRSPHHPDHVAHKPTNKPKETKVAKPEEKGKEPSKVAKLEEKGKEPTKVAKPEEKGKEPSKVAKLEEKGKEPTKVAKLEEKGKEPSKVFKKAVFHRFVKFNERTGECGFDARWWYCFVVYQSTVGRYDDGPVDYDALQAPADITVTPPVLKAGQGLPMSAAGSALAARLDALDVENHWLPGQDVSWKTGNPVSDDKGPASNGGVFVAAVCARLKVAMPEPAPESFLPANQYDWLLNEGPSKGWVQVGDIEAQLLANQGWLVIAGWKNPKAAGDKSLAGQTAIVRPNGKASAEVAKRGPQIIMAGTQNRNDSALKDCFPAQTATEVIFLAFRSH